MATKYGERAPISHPKNAGLGAVKMEWLDGLNLLFARGANLALGER